MKSLTLRPDITVDMSKDVECTRKGIYGECRLDTHSLQRVDENAYTF